MIEADFDVSLEDGAPGRSRLLLATAERDRLEGVLRLLPRALEGGSPHRVADVLAQGACLLADARLGWVLLPESLRVAVLGGPDAGSVDARVHPGSWPVVTAALGGVPMHIPDLVASDVADVGASPPGTGQPRVVTADGRELRSISALPICGGQDGVRGVLVLAHHRAQAFSERRLALVAALADHLGQVLDLCETVREQTKVAAALQETLLPPVLPVIEGVELAARYRPSGSGNLVGGDF